MFDPAFEIALPFFTEKSLFKVGSLRGTKILKKNLFKSLLFCYYFHMEKGVAVYLNNFELIHV